MSPRKWTAAHIETIRQLAEQGRSGASISAETNISQGMIWKLCAQHGIKIRRRHSTGTNVRFYLDAEAYRGLVEQAEGRYEPVGHLVRLLIETIVYENLFPAILDGSKVKPKPKYFGWPAGASRSAKDDADNIRIKPAPAPSEPLSRGNAYSAPAPKPPPPPAPVPEPYCIAVLTAPMLFGSVASMSS